MRLSAVASVMFGFLVVGSVAQATDEGFQIVISEKNPVSSLPISEVQLMFLKSIPLWPKGMKVRPVDLPVSSSVRREFSLRVMGKDAQAVRAYWEHQVFAGEAVPPPILPTEDAVIAFVAENTGAIAYVSASARLPGGVKSIRLTE